MSHPTPIPRWFETLIREGLATLHVLNLEGYPADDVVEFTTNVWLNHLWASPRREWHMDADTPCIRAAFQRLCLECYRWPSPAKFMEVLPARAPFEGKALPPRVFSLEERRENLKRLSKMGEELLGIKVEEGP